MFDRRQLLAGFAALPLAACATSGSISGGGSNLKLATYNIWHNQGDWRAREPLVIETLRAVDADVIGLQEVLQDPATSLANQAATIAEALGYEMVFVSTDPENSPRRYGNAILTRLPIMEQDWKKLEPLDDVRTAVRIRVMVGGRPIDIVNTHFHHTPEGAAIRARQVADLMAWLGERDAPLIIMGDLNAALSNPELTPLQSPRFDSLLAAVHPDQAGRTTLNTAHGHRYDQIDHILIQPEHFTPVSAVISGDVASGGVWPSDHFVVSGTVTLKPA